MVSGQHKQTNHLSRDIIWVAFHVDQGPWDEEILVWDHCRTLSDTKQRQIKHKIIQDTI